MTVEEIEEMAKGRLRAMTLSFDFLLSFTYLPSLELSVVVRKSCRLPSLLTPHYLYYIHKVIIWIQLYRRLEGLETSRDEAACCSDVKYSVRSSY
jgi:hypothetical protein